MPVLVAIPLLLFFAVPIFVAPPSTEPVVTPAPTPIVRSPEPTSTPIPATITALSTGLFEVERGDTVQVPVSITTNEQLRLNVYLAYGLDEKGSLVWFQDVDSATEVVGVPVSFSVASGIAFLRFILDEGWADAEVVVRLHVGG